MRIVSMTATFGKLDHETMDLSGGLNVLSAPNEWGKSTWCAFLCAMLYGIDTRERSTKDALADKERYLPWSGKPMEGTMRIVHEGRDITIQRRTRGRIPMGDFLAYETHSGLEIRELTAENCGQVLLGVEKSVFLRTGFLRFSDLPVRSDESLRRRLNALVTTGDESGSAELLGSKLRELKNRCRYNHSGLIPECNAEIQSLQEKLRERKNLQRRHDQLERQVREQTSELTLLENHRNELAWQDAEEDRKRVEHARTAARAADRLARELESKFGQQPDRTELENKIKQGRDLLEELDLSLVEEPAQAWPTTLTALLAGVLLICALLLMDSSLMIPCIVMGVILAVCSIYYWEKRRQDRLWFQVERTRIKNRRDELETHLEKWNEQLQVIKDLDRARQDAKMTLEQLHVLEAMARKASRPETVDTLTTGREETMELIGQLTRELSHSRDLLAQCRGSMENLPDAGILEARLALSQRRLRELEKTHQAIGYAQNALEAAMQELQRRFAPRIARRAGQFLSHLTGGVYDRIAINDDLTVQAARNEENTLRTAQWRSEGTGDQMYLALRLAVWEVLAPDSPLVLDDALVRFDQGRMERAMELLSLLAKERQILLFSCQEREKQYLMR